MLKSCSGLHLRACEECAQHRDAGSCRAQPPAFPGPLQSWVCGNTQASSRGLASPDVPEPPAPPPRSPFLALTALSPLCSLPTFSLRCGLVFSFQGIFCMEECFQCAEALIAKSWLPKHVILASSWYRAGGVFPSWRRRKKKNNNKNLLQQPRGQQRQGAEASVAHPAVCEGDPTPVRLLGWPG